MPWLRAADAAGRGGHQGAESQPGASATIEPQGGSPRVKCPGYALLTPRAGVRTKVRNRKRGLPPDRSRAAGVRTRVRIATGGFRPSAQDFGKRDAKHTEPQGGSPRVKCPATHR